MRPLTLFAVIVCVGAAALGQGVLVPNPSFEDGGRAPKGWTLAGGRGRWIQGGAKGKRAVAVSGNGTDSSYWRSGPLAMQPGGVYRLRFQAKKLRGSGGTPIAGPAFCNVDLREISDQWRPHAFCFVAPADLKAQDAWLRFGQWHVNGTVAFDAIELHTAIPVYRIRGELVLGDGESVREGRYRFQAPLAKDGRNHSRPLVRHRCHFNSNRWVFGADSEVIYCHRVGGRSQTAADVDVTIGWYRGGQLVVEAGRDGKTWHALGRMDKCASSAFKLPAELLPAKAVWIRLRSQARRRVGADSDPGSFQVHAYAYHAALDAPCPPLRGSTRYVAVTQHDPRLKVAVTGLGDGLPGGRNALEARVDNVSGEAIVARPSLKINGPSGQVEAAIPRTALKPGTTPLRLRYPVPGVGPHGLVFTLGEGIRFRAETRLSVPELHDTSYGQLLSASSKEAAVWWASSGWKISRTRSAPKAEGKAILIRAARNEAEAAQLVVRPAKPMKGLAAKATALTGPGGARIPAASVKLLRVGYVEVTRPTDRTGVVGPWPDPLPPLAGPIDLAAEQNQPLWVRVKVPRTAPPGLYKGGIQLTAKGYEAMAPLHVQVYGFVLPDRMTCKTAFGFSPGNVWRYQNVRGEAQRRAVLDEYLANFGAHHISPYDPAPLDRFGVKWQGASPWRGGRRDTDVKHAGKAALEVEDASKTAGPHASYAALVRIPKGGLRLRLWYKAAKGHRFIVSLTHHEASGKWLWGQNNDLHLEGTGDWTGLDRTIKQFPKAATSVGLNLWPALYAEDGSTTGTVWYDDVSLQDAASGRELLAGGDFEPAAKPPTPTFDFSAWDKAMAKAVDRFHFNTFRLRIQGMGGGTFHARHEPSLLGYAENTPEYKAAFTAYCRTLQEHLREKGWLDEAFIYWFDEPAPKDYAFVMNGFRKLKAAAPGLTRMLTEQVEPALIGGPNLWCPVSPRYDHEAAEKRRKHGEHFWWYICTGPKAPYCTLFIDHPATELRVWLWQTWQRKIEGILVWQTNYWTSSAAYPDPKNPQNPYADPMGWTSGYSTPKGTKRAWGNGDGRFIYPPEAAADAKPPRAVLDGPVDSIRWEMLRDGIEDYEYLAMLQRLLKERGDKLDARRRARLGALLTVPASITSDMTTFTKRPEPIEGRRDEIARAIESLLRAEASGR